VIASATMAAPAFANRPNPRRIRTPATPPVVERVSLARG
jgi:hypothetical protein